MKLWESGVYERLTAIVVFIMISFVMIFLAVTLPSMEGATLTLKILGWGILFFAEIFVGLALYDLFWR